MTAPKRLIYGRPWAIRPTDLDSIRANAENWVPKPEAAKPMAPMMDDGETMAADGVAVVECAGVIIKSMSILDEILGGVVAVGDVQEEFDEAMASDAKTVILRIDSPGGTVSGVPELASHIFQTRQDSDKTLVAFVDGMACSAAYWLAAQCDSIVMTEASEVGSIGVIATCYDFDRMYKNAGVDPHTFRSDDMKGAGGDNYQDIHGRAIMEQVQTYNTMFRTAVARGRSITIDQLNAFAPDSRVAIGADAVKAGFADEVSTWDKVLSQYRR